MIANIYVPLWPFGVAFIVLCFVPDVLKIVKQRRARRGLRVAGALSGVIPLPAPLSRAGGSDGWYGDAARASFPGAAARALEMWRERR